MNSKELIARRVAKELKNGYVVNLGIGLPTMVANYIPEGVEVYLQAENGMLGVGPVPEEGRADKDIFDAGCNPVTCRPGAMFFDSAYSFGLIRGGHVDVTVLGALQVDERGNLASWMVPGKKVTGMGGAMDLVVGARKVIIAMEHTAKGSHKILKECSFPLTAVSVVNKIITELGVMDVTENGLLVKELAPGVTKEQIMESTGAQLQFDPLLQVMNVS